MPFGDALLEYVGNVFFQVAGLIVTVVNVVFNIYINRSKFNEQWSRDAPSLKDRSRRLLKVLTSILLNLLLFLSLALFLVMILGFKSQAMMFSWMVSFALPSTLIMWIVFRTRQTKNKFHSTWYRLLPLVIAMLLSAIVAFVGLVNIVFWFVLGTWINFGAM